MAKLPKQDDRCPMCGAPKSGPDAVCDYCNLTRANGESPESAPESALESAPESALDPGPEPATKSTMEPAPERSRKRAFPLIVPIAALLALAIAAGGIVFFALRAPRGQAVDFRDNSLNSAERQYVQGVADKAGRPGRGKVELLSYSTKYVKDDEGNVKELVVVGLLRNGYNTDVQIDTLELTVKTGDDETEIASAAFEGDYGVIGKRSSIIWKFTFTEDFIFVKDADLSKTVNHLSYTITRK